MFSPARLIARLLTGSTYALLGFDAARAPGGRVETAAPTLAMMRQTIPLPENDELVVRANGALQAAAGAALAVGFHPRLSALALLGSLVPTTAAGHAFWTIEDPAARRAQQVQFAKNMAMLGGLIYIAVDRPKPLVKGPLIKTH